MSDFISAAHEIARVNGPLNIAYANDTLCRKSRSFAAKSSSSKRVRNFSLTTALTITMRMRMRRTREAQLAAGRKIMLLWECCKVIIVCLINFFTLKWDWHRELANLREWEQKIFCE
jgi:hypothetical protein